jgi:hypothetical protein
VEGQSKDDPQFREGTSGPNYWAGHKNFLLGAIRRLYFEGTPEKLAEARDIYTYLRAYDLDDENRVKPQYLVPFDRFVLQTIFDALQTPSGARALMTELLLCSLINLSNNEDAAAVAHFNQARKTWDYYMRDMSTDRTGPCVIEPIEVIRRNAALHFLQSFEYSLLQKYRMWRNLDTVTRQAVYDEARPWIERYCAGSDPPLDPGKVLPEPPGMEEHRADPDRVLRALQRFGEESAGEKMEDQ